MAKSSVIANTTNISNRIFRTQRYIVSIVLAVFILLLIVTSLVAHKHIKDNHPDVYQKLGNSLESYKVWADEGVSEWHEEPKSDKLE